jgi:hypothetical protein
VYVCRSPRAYCPFVEERSCQLPRLLGLCEQVLGVDKVPATEYVRVKVLIRLRELTSRFSVRPCETLGVRFLSGILTPLH